MINMSNNELRGSAEHDNNKYGYGDQTTRSFDNEDHERAAAAPAVETPPENNVHPTRLPRAPQRRASLGAFPSSTTSSSNNNSDDDDNDDDAFGAMRLLVPQPSSIMSKSQQEDKLRQSLAKLSDYKDHDDKIQILRETFFSQRSLCTTTTESSTNNATHRRTQRRSSLSSVSLHSSGYTTSSSPGGDSGLLENNSFVVERSSSAQPRRMPRRSSLSSMTSLQSSSIHSIQGDYGYEQSLEAQRTSPKRTRMPRRSSLSSSIHSCTSHSSVFATAAAATTTPLQHSRSRDETEISLDFSADLNNNNNNNNATTTDGCYSSYSNKRASEQDISWNMSSATVPVNNLGGIKSSSQSSEVLFEKNNNRFDQSDQIVESLVWFSFHTPRTVLEDLITHELDLWRRQHHQQQLNSKDHRHRSSSACHNKRNNKRNNKSSSSSSSGRHRDANTIEKSLFMTPQDQELSSDNDIDESLSGGSGSLSSLSDDGGDDGDGDDGCLLTTEVFDGNFTESMLRLRRDGGGNNNMIKLPKSVKRESALLFVDMSGFTKLSTLLDVESLSKVINSYFDMITSEVILHGGDILKFAGDAFFAEWKVMEEDDDEDGNGSNNPLVELNASLASIVETNWDDDDDIPKLSTCVLSAAKCAAAIVKKFSDYHVTSASNGTSEAMLNVHCGIGCGSLVGLHVGDYREDQEQEEDAVELRREFLILGSPIDQVSKAADVATDGQVMASPEAMLQLAFCCDVPEEQRFSSEPVCIASRDEMSLNLAADVLSTTTDAQQPYESLRMHCKSLNHLALARLLLQMALYVHPVIRGDELSLSAAVQAGKSTQPRKAIESRHLAEAELRSVFTIFIKPIITPSITGTKEIDEDLFKTLCDIMHVTSRELDRYSGHLRQFIVDDKGVVLIATFGLRGSTFPNMISNNGLPAVFAIHRSLKAALNVESRIGATFGKVYCGVVGGVRRHEFAVMGAPVNLAARLMSSKVNKGILVDEAVSEQADSRFAFNSLPPVEAKGYDKPVSILEPRYAVTGNKKKRSSFAFVGRQMEKDTVTNIAHTILADPLKSHSTMVFLMGESGMGKSALALSVMDDIRKNNPEDTKKTIVFARSTSTETEQRVPLSSYRKVFMSVVHDLCVHDGTLSQIHDDGKSLASSSGQSLTSKWRSGLSSEYAKLEQRPSFAKFRGASEYIKLKQRPSLTKDRVAAQKHLVMKSLRDIRAELASPKKLKKFLPSSVSLSHSAHGDKKMASRRPEGLTHSLHHGKSSPALIKKETLGQSLHRISMGRSMPFSPSLTRDQPTSSRHKRASGVSDEISMGSFDESAQLTASVSYFEKLCWVCEQLEYPYEYADIVGSQFLGLDGASPVTHVDGHIPTMDELVEFLALAFICIADYAHLTVVFLDDFHWVDSFSWRIFRVLCKRGNKLLIMCATLSHDKQALRRLSSVASAQDQMKMVEIALGPLDFDEIRHLMATVLDHTQEQITDSLCTDIFQRTGGLPVYVLQVLENIKRKKIIELNENGLLQWTAEGLKEKRAFASNKTGVVMAETFLSRFDALDIRTRKVLQTCAVLGQTFALSDVIQVHPEMEEIDIEHALDVAIDEMILVEHIEVDDETFVSQSTSDSKTSLTVDYSRTADGNKTLTDRFFQFSHAMWQKNVLATMLKERKIELHRLIAEAMEKDQVLILEQSDISRLLTLFDHWKSCGDFCKTAPLALVVGSRLEEWGLVAQSLDTLRDALEMSIDSVESVDEVDTGNDEWVQVGAKPAVLDYILRLHIRIGLCYQKLGEDDESIGMFEDAYNIISTASKIPGLSKSLMMPIISSLCVLKLEQVALDTRTKLEHKKLAEKFVREAIRNGEPVHIGRALAMEATHFAMLGNFDRALDDLERLNSMYDVKAYSFEMIAEYSRDFGLECYCESAQWYFLIGRRDEAEKQADAIIQGYLPLLDQVDADIAMCALFPIIQLLMNLGRAKNAHYLFKKYVIDPYSKDSSLAEYWVPLSEAMTFLLELVVMEETQQYDPQVLSNMEEWALEEEIIEGSVELERKVHTVLGEICCRLASLKDDGYPVRNANALAQRASDLLTPIARYPHQEVFLRHIAQKLMQKL